MKKKATIRKYLGTGMCDLLQPKFVVNNAPSTAMKRNWKKVMMFPEEGSSLGHTRSHNLIMITKRKLLDEEF